MLTHKQIMTTLINLRRYNEELSHPLVGATYASYLPMAHIFGYMLNLGFFYYGKLALCSPMTLLDSSPGHVPGQTGDLKLVRPEYMPAVPLVLERVLKEVYRKLHAKSPIAAPLFTYLMDYKIRWRARGLDTPILN